MFEIDEEVKTSPKARSVFKVVGLEHPLPHVDGGVTNVLVINTKSKNPKIRRFDPKHLIKA